jgi:hypothetical protein
MGGKGDNEKNTELIQFISKLYTQWKIRHDVGVIIS